VFNPFIIVVLGGELLNPLTTKYLYSQGTIVAACTAEGIADVRNVPTTVIRRRNKRVNCRYTLTITFSLPLFQCNSGLDHLVNTAHPKEAYEQIEALWKQLEGSYYALAILPKDENN
jgi:hypothetical protein